MVPKNLLQNSKHKDEINRIYYQHASNLPTLSSSAGELLTTGKRLDPILNQDLVEETPQHKRILLYSKDATPFSFQSEGDFTPAELQYPPKKNMIIEEESYS